MTKYHEATIAKRHYVVPPIEALKAKYPIPDKYSRELIYSKLGMVMPLGKEWENTCALRLSCCLIFCGIDLGKEPIRDGKTRGEETRIKAGFFENKYVWLSRASLAARVRQVFGKPTFIAGPSHGDKKELELKIRGTGGIISYGKLGAERSFWENHEAYPGGHIDVVVCDKGVLWSDYRLMIGHDFDMMFRRAEEIIFWRSGGG